jgi:hypothetical protein
MGPQGRLYGVQARTGSHGGGVVKPTKNRGCTGKIRHETRREAVKHLWRIVRRGASPFWLNVYKCRHCNGGFHVGHKQGRRR